MKKILSGLLSVLMVISSFSVVFAERFTDFPQEDYAWAYDQVMEMVEQGYITGYEDNTFKPDNGVTRLEVLALFSRAMGALKPENETVLDMAVADYEEILKPYKLPWGTNEISFLLYRDVLTTDDLNTYLEGDLKNEPMPRYEAAIIITKAMGGKRLASGNQSVTLDFTDFKDIPSNSLQYVKYVVDNGIMMGMEDGSFSPKTSVLRTQMAVMLKRVIDKVGYEFLVGKIQNIDSDGRIVTVADSEGNTQKYTYLDTVMMKVEGAETLPKNMIVGVDAAITLSNNKIAFIDTMSSIPDETVFGTFVSRASKGDVVTLTIKDSKTGKTVSYDCSPSVSVTYNDEPATLTSFKLNDFMVLEIVNGVIERVAGDVKTTTVPNAVISNIILDPEFSMVIAHADAQYDGMSYPISNDVTVLKNNDTADFDELKIGDRVTLTLTYGMITAVRATSSTKNTAGTIKEVRISSTPSIVVNIGGEEQTYVVSQSVEVKVNGAAGTLYDFRVGDSVKITLESETVVKIESTTAQVSNGKLEGTVSAVNPSYGFIKLAYTNEFGQTVEETVYCKDSTTNIMNAAGVPKKLKDVKVGNVVTVHGTVSNGAFTAKILVISAE